MNPLGRIKPSRRPFVGLGLLLFAACLAGLGWRGWQAARCTLPVPEVFSGAEAFEDRLRQDPKRFAASGESEYYRPETLPDGAELELISASAAGPRLSLEYAFGAERLRYG